MSNQQTQETLAPCESCGAACARWEEREGEYYMVPLVTPSEPGSGWLDCPVDWGHMGYSLPYEYR